MTATIIQFSPRDPFASVCEALAYYADDARRDQLLSRMRPPLDAIGDEGCDAYLCNTFLGLLAMDALSKRIFSLAAVALDIMGLAERLRERGHEAEADLQHRMAMVLVRWRDTLSDRALKNGAA